MNKVTVSNPPLRIKQYIGKLTNKLKSNKMRHGVFLNLTIAINDMYSNPTKVAFLANALGQTFHRICDRLQQKMMRFILGEHIEHLHVWQGNNWPTYPTMMSPEKTRKSNPPKARFQLVDFVYLASCARNIIIFCSWKPGLSIPCTKNVV